MEYNEQQRMWNGRPGRPTVSVTCCIGRPWNADACGVDMLAEIRCIRSIWGTTSARGIDTHVEVNCMWNAYVFGTSYGVVIECRFTCGACRLEALMESNTYGVEGA